MSATSAQNPVRSRRSRRTNVRLAFGRHLGNARSRSSTVSVYAQCAPVLPLRGRRRICSVTNMTNNGAASLTPLARDYLFKGISGMAVRHLERHRIASISWLRAAVPGANDGIVSTSSLVLGVAAAHATHGSVLIAGVAGLVAGAMSRWPPEST